MAVLWIFTQAALSSGEVLSVQGLQSSEVLGMLPLYSQGGVSGVGVGMGEGAGVGAAKVSAQR